MASTSRPYQGYPYVTRPAIDPSSISASDAARWNNLPRRQLELNVNRHEPTNNPSVEDSESVPDKRESNPAVVYIDMPEASGSDVVNRPEPSSGCSQTVPKPDPDDEDPVPVVYIDMPDPNGSSVALTATATPQDGPAFVQQTIFYNQFDNKIIHRAEDSDDEEEPTHNPNIPARRPNTLNLNAGGAGTSAGVSTSYPSSSVITKETDIYGNRDSAGLPLPFIEASQFPEPPPSYDAIDNNRPVATSVEPSRPSPAIPPRTQVILPGDSHHVNNNNNIPSSHTGNNSSSSTPVANNIPLTPTGYSHHPRKYMTCHHCNTRVHTLVVKENGIFTHVAGFVCLLLCMLPLVACVYCTDWFKLKNHYCPNCNRVIGYQLRMLDDKMIMVD